MWHVSAIVLVYYVFFFPFCFVVLITFMELQEMVSEFIYSHCCECSVGFCHLILVIIFCRYVCWFYVSKDSGDCMVCLVSLTL